MKVPVQTLKDSLKAMAMLLLLLPLGEDPEQQLGTAPVKFPVAQSLSHQFITFTSAKDAMRGPN